MIATVMDIIYPHIFLTGNSCKIDMLNIKCSKSAETSLETEEQAQLPHEELQYLNLVKHIIKTEMFEKIELEQELCPSLELN